MFSNTSSGKLKLASNKISVIYAFKWNVKTILKFIIGEYDNFLRKLLRR